MNCEEIAKLIPLYHYGELSPEEEEHVDEHTHVCAACTRAMEQQRVLAAALDRRALNVPVHLLDDCRADLMAAVQGGAPRAVRTPKGPWTLFLEAMAHTFGNLNRLRQPVGAVALIAIGFFAAKLIGRFPAGSPASNMASMLNPADEVYSTIRSVQPDPDNSGRVIISFDETHRRSLHGQINDAGVQKLLLAGMYEDNPAVRGESVRLLKSQCRSGEVKETFLNALTDPNPDVQMNAIEGLKPLAGDPQVRHVLGQVLRMPVNDAVKMQAIEMLSAHRDDTIVGLMQALVQREQSNSVRLKMEKALREMNASIGTF
ncbi:MAG TPA: HEAT repeat domain-containing protein [Candidatus Acidoferrales bacterium]|nr:HEAT repeat domain-containing protein [Candidatus Acidoferrales bacterium]